MLLEDRFLRLRRGGLTWAALTLAAWLTACGSSPRLSAPSVEDRSTRSPAAAAAAALAEAAGTHSTSSRTAAAGNGVVVSGIGNTAPDGSAKPLPGAENAGKPGYYSVKPGDTMIRIGLETGQNWRDIARWNGMENSNVIEVGQVLRVLPPGSDGTTAPGSKPVAGTRVDPRSPETKPVPTAPGAVPPGTPPATVPPPAPAPPVAAPAVTREADDVNWAWPAGGAVLAGYDEARNKGLSIGGKAGDAVLAAADGRVVYAGSGLRGYGNLVILKHNTTYLTAYAHNQTLLVKEDQQVKRGQKIAEMGSTDAERVQLHFEIRKLGKPVDPARLLPPR